MKLILKTVLMTLLSAWVGAVFSQDVVVTGSMMPGKGPREPVLIKRQGASPVLVVEIRAPTTDTEAHELHQKVLIALREVYEERVFPLNRKDDSRIQQSIRCTVVVTSSLFGASLEVRCGRRFPRNLFVGLSDSGIATSESSAVAGRVLEMLDETYGLALKLPER